jgi:uncharacterized membrane protein (UPF0127 family)
VAPDRATRRWVAHLRAAVLVLLLGTATGQPVFAQDANAPLPRKTLTAGIHRINAEIADEPRTRQRGLMMRERLGPNEGMLFVFEDSAVHCFWMKNTPLPLSIAFIDDQGRVVNLADMTPHSEDSHCPLKPIRYALEMEQGWFARRGIGGGDRIGGLR